MFRYAIPLVLLVPALALAYPPTPTETLKHAATVLDEIQEVPEKGFPKALFNDAEAVVIVPNTVKVGFIVGGRFGHGVAILKEKNGGWGDIRFVTVGGASVGFQAGAQVQDIVLVFKNRKGLDRLLEKKTKLTLGADASITAGPLGRDAAIATDALWKSEIVSYSRARGLFAGVALDGAVMAADSDANDSFGKDSKEETRKAAETLKSKVSLAAAERIPPATVPPSTVTVPPATIPVIPGDLPRATVPTIPGTPTTPSVVPYIPPGSPAPTPGPFPRLRRIFGKG